MSTYIFNKTEAGFNLQKDSGPVSEYVAAVVSSSVDSSTSFSFRINDQVIHFSGNDSISIGATPVTGSATAIRDALMNAVINNYVTPSDVQVDSTHRFVTDAEKTTWNSKAAGTHTHAATDITPDSTRRFVTDAEKASYSRQILVSNVNIPHTGDTVEYTAFTGTIPANSIAVNGSFEFLMLWGFIGAAGSHTVRLRINGTLIFQHIVSSTGSLRATTFLANRNSLTSQITGAVGSSSAQGFGTAATSAANTTSFNTATDLTLTATTQNASAADTSSLEALKVTAIG